MKTETRPYKLRFRFDGGRYRERKFRSLDAAMTGMPCPPFIGSKVEAIVFYEGFSLAKVRPSGVDFDVDYAGWDHREFIRARM